RMAFYDDLSDITAGPIAYLVCGWYSDPSLDPLGSEIHSLADFHARMNELGWELDKGELQESVSKASKYIQAASLIGLKTLEASAISTTASPSTTTGAATNRAATNIREAAITQAIPIIAGAGSTPSPLDDAGHPVEGFYKTDGSWWPKQIICHGSV